ncbi:MAG: hypothetical protein V4591_05350 [Bdellovibrionota bacterium]
MKVRSVIIDYLNLEFLDSDIAKLSNLIDKVLLHRRNPIVLINEQGDDLLRKVPKLLDCDLVYSERSSRDFEGLMTGLHGAGTCAFYLPLRGDYGDEEMWLEMEKTLIQLEYMHKTHILIPKGLGPWLITPTGTLYLKSKDSSYELEKDKNLNKLEIEKR